jgi:pSer/pThr/pTyr-binding forkhead associated (FHA) protein
MLQIIFRHISGSRATEIDIVPMGAHQELILGRADSAAVRFDPWGDPMVGRQHARVAPSAGDSRRLLLSDLGSRNGTLLNGQPVFDGTAITSGDLIQLGATGPQLEITIEFLTCPNPRPN